MNNSLIRKRLKMETKTAFSNQYFRQVDSKAKSISNPFLSKSFDIQIKNDQNSTDYIKLHPKTAIKNSTVFSVKIQEKSPFLGKEFEPTNQIFRKNPNNKDQLKPQQNSKELKQIQQKITTFQKYNPKKYYKDDTNHLQRLDITFLQNSKLSKLLGSRNNAEEQIQSERIPDEQRRTTYNDWYLKAIETHLKQNNQKIDLKYSTQQNTFTQKTVLNQKRIGNTMYPKLSTGFKKRSVSYQIKYI